MRSPSATIITAQSAASRTPYIHMVFSNTGGTTTYDLSMDSVAYGNRILSIEHNEEPYNGYATIILRNYDMTIPSMIGFWTEIAYGMTTGAGNEYANTITGRLWVKYQRHISAGGRVLTVLELEDTWKMLSETIIRLGTAPAYTKAYPTAAETVYDIMGVICTEANVTLSALGGVDDSIIDTLIPTFVINEQPFEDAGALLYRLIRMTKCYLKMSMAKTLTVKYPQAADAVDITYTSDTAPYFYEFMQRWTICVPNHFKVFGNMNETSIPWSNIKTGDASIAADVSNYMDAYELLFAPLVTDQTMLDLLASAAALRAKAETDAGVGVVPHDARVELYDNIAFRDKRVGDTTYPSYTLSRVHGLTHTYKPGIYTLTIYLGGVSNTQMDQYSPINLSITGGEVKSPPFIGPPYIPPEEDEYIQSMIRDNGYGFRGESAAFRNPNVTELSSGEVEASVPFRQPTRGGITTPDLLAPVVRAVQNYDPLPQSQFNIATWIASKYLENIKAGYNFFRGLFGGR
jgi:hypothetical protein